MLIWVKLLRRLGVEMSSLIRDDLNELAKRWLMYKETEKIAAENRRNLEDVICKAVNYGKDINIIGPK